MAPWYVTKRPKIEFVTHCSNTESHIHRATQNGFGAKVVVLRGNKWEERFCSDAYVPPNTDNRTFEAAEYYVYVGQAFNRRAYSCTGYPPKNKDGLVRIRQAL